MGDPMIAAHAEVIGIGAARTTIFKKGKTLGVRRASFAASTPGLSCRQVWCDFGWSAISIA